MPIDLAHEQNNHFRKFLVREVGSTDNPSSWVLPRAGTMIEVLFHQIDSHGYQHQNRSPKLMGIRSYTLRCLLIASTKFSYISEWGGKR